MIRLSENNLMKLKVRYVIHDNELYFDVLEIKEHFPDKKFPPDKIKSLPIKGMYTNTIRLKDVENLTEFDKNVLKFMKHKPE